MKLFAVLQLVFILFYFLYFFNALSLCFILIFSIEFKICDSFSSLEFIFILPINTNSDTLFLFYFYLFFCHLDRFMKEESLKERSDELHKVCFIVKITCFSSSFDGFVWFANFIDLITATYDLNLVLFDNYSCEEGCSLAPKFVFYS